MAKKNKDYYVAILRGVDTKTGDYKMRFVTSLPKHNTAEWKEGEPPLPMSLKLAEDVRYGLCVNMHLAIVVDAEYLRLKNPTIKDNKEVDE